MIDYMEDEFKNTNIKYMKLTAQTRVDTRIDLVNKFNEDDEIKVFLISLKAGGTGLNLIGADMVIHYDPWWNLSAENQATDRTYRIGQKRNVQVYKLITKNSIEYTFNSSALKYFVTLSAIFLASSLFTSFLTFITKFNVLPLT